MAEQQPPTDYVILRSVDGQETWTTDGPIQKARSAEQAVKQAAALRHESGVESVGMYVAVPVRSWNPVPIKPRVVFDIEAA